MGNLDQHTVFMIATALLAGGLIGWLLASLGGKRKLGEVESDWTARYDKALQQIEKLNTQTRALQTALQKSRETYTGQLMFAVEQRQRLEGLDKLENKVEALEAENAELRHRATAATREADALQHDVAKLQELKKQNKEFAHCLLAIENSRRQYEADAKRYRRQYEQAVKQSDTSRMKLGNIGESFIPLREAEEEAPGAGLGNLERLPPLGLTEPEGEPDDLTEIVGIGKVFEQMLHELGVFHYRQIAAFGPEDVARVNSELREFRGRIEDDDWIGQAKALHFRKYGQAPDDDAHTSALQ